MFQLYLFDQLYFICICIYYDHMCCCVVLCPCMLSPLFRIVLDLEKHLHTHPVQKVLDIGIITFYSAQVKTIKLQLQKHGVRVDGSNNAPFRVKVMSNHKKSVGFLKDFQRLNVALTRAKHHLVMIGDTDTLQQSDCNDLQNLIVEMKGRSVVVDQEHAFRHEAHHSSWCLLAW